MTCKTLPLTVASALALAACSSSPAEDPPLAGDWVLSAEESNLSFTTVKAGQIAEAHHFTRISGAISAAGAAELAIDLASVETNIDIRNERMRELLFDVADFPSANVSLALDPSSYAGLQSGESIPQQVTATLDVHGASGEVAADVTVTRLAAGKVRVASVTPVIVDAGAFDLAEGVEELREIAGLDSIARQVPVSFSLTFEQQ